LDPEVYQTDSSEEKYSNEDREFKDQLLQGEEALQNSIKRYGTS